MGKKGFSLVERNKILRASPPMFTDLSIKEDFCERFVKKDLILVGDITRMVAREPSKN